MAALWQIALTVPQAQAEIFAALFEDTALAVSVQQPPRQSLAQIEALYAAQPEATGWQQQVAALAALHDVLVPDVRIAPVPETDWLRHVALATPPRQIGRLVIYGAHSPAPSAAVPSLQLEAATAFGTGEHPSTHMCLLLLQRVLRHTTPRRALDVGCGSGILALSLARLAHRPCVAVDCDAESVRMTRENARHNGLARYLTPLVGSGYALRQVRQRRPYDLIFANIFARPLMALAADLRAHLAPGGYAILSGLLTTQAPMVLAAHRLQRLHVVAALQQNEWSALLLQKRQR
jgi:ribosomal protein L11 methyltransferase